MPRVDHLRVISIWNTRCLARSCWLISACVMSGSKWLPPVCWRFGEKDSSFAILLSILPITGHHTTCNDIYCHFLDVGTSFGYFICIFRSNLSLLWKYLHEKLHVGLGSLSESTFLNPEWFFDKSRCLAGQHMNSNDPPFYSPFYILQNKHNL